MDKLEIVKNHCLLEVDKKLKEKLDRQEEKIDRITCAIEQQQKKMDENHKDVIDKIFEAVRGNKVK